MVTKWLQKGYKKVTKWLQFGKKIFYKKFIKIT